MAEKVDYRAARLEEIMNQSLDLYKKKNADYGNSFAEVYKELGFESGLVQILHKVNRIKGIYNNDRAEIKNESIRDSLIDLANYSLMTVVEMELEDKQKRLIKNIRSLGLFVKEVKGNVFVGLNDSNWDIAEIEEKGEGKFRLLGKYWTLEDDVAKDLWNYILEYLIENKG